ncbi:MAG: cell division protein ZapA [Lachnospiraceae bacterium]|nr:cell division protein ZapA [Lachnospiraceae bacterium]
MAEKNSVQVLIGGKVITLSGYETSEYLEKVASYMNHKQQELQSLPNWRRMSSEMKSTAITLNAIDDYFKAKKRAEELEEELRLKDTETYQLKQELVELQIQMEQGPANAGSGTRSGNQNGGHRRH